MIYHSPAKKIDGFNELKVRNLSIKRVSDTIYLGLHLDDQLKWDKHVNHVCNGLAKNFHVFYNIRNCLNDELKKQLYYSLVYSRIQYGVEIYGGCRESLMRRVQVVQNKLLKVLFDLPMRTNTNILHSRLKILKVKDIYNIQVTKFVYESLNQLSIAQFHNHFKYRSTIHRHDTRNQNDLYPKKVRTAYGESTIHNKGTKLWNGLCPKIKASKSLYTFKKTLKAKILTYY